MSTTISWVTIKPIEPNYLHCAADFWTVLERAFQNFDPPYFIFSTIDIPILRGISATFTEYEVNPAAVLIGAIEDAECSIKVYREY